VDGVIVTVDPTFESFAIAEKVAIMCKEMGVGRVMAILNKVDSQEIESCMLKGLEGKVEVLGVIRTDETLLKAGLMGTAIGECPALEDMAAIIERLEVSL
jgi:CO dehydrogenase nickel-insertion accessory protein CooC1